MYVHVTNRCDRRNMKAHPTKLGTKIWIKFALQNTAVITLRMLILALVLLIDWPTLTLSLTLMWNWEAQCWQARDNLLFLTSHWVKFRGKGMEMHFSFKVKKQFSLLDWWFFLFLYPHFIFYFFLTCSPRIWVTRLLHFSLIWKVSNTHRELE